jgi:hypothetical protein
MAFSSFYIVSNSPIVPLSTSSSILCSFRGKQNGEVQIEARSVKEGRTKGEQKYISSSFSNNEDRDLGDEVQTHIL